MLKGQVALVTGASRGLGKHCALALAKAGCDVAILARDNNQLAQTAGKINALGQKCFFSPCDLTQPDSIKGFLKQSEQVLGPVDILINNAGIGSYKPFLEHSIEEVINISQLNLTAMMLLSHWLLPNMIKNKRGSIINIGSDVSQKPLANMAPYVASKFGVRGFTQSLLREYKNQGIKIMQLNPGIMDTHFNQGKEGSKEINWALNAREVSETIMWMLNQPHYQLIDEINIHALDQDF